MPGMRDGEGVMYCTPKPRNQDEGRLLYQRLLIYWNLELKRTALRGGGREPCRLLIQDFLLFEGPELFHHSSCNAPLFMIMYLCRCSVCSSMSGRCSDFGTLY